MEITKLIEKLLILFRSVQVARGLASSERHSRYGTYMDYISEWPNEILVLIIFQHCFLFCCLG